jgi:hypothetical protein
LLQNAGKFGQNLDFCLKKTKKLVTGANGKSHSGHRCARLAPLQGEVLPPVFHISTNPVYRAILWVCTGFSTVSTWFSTFPQWKDVENLCKMWRKPAEARRGGIFCGSFKVVSHAVHFLGACYNSYKR